MTRLKVTVSSLEEALSLPCASAVGVCVDAESRESILAARDIFASLPVFTYTIAEIEPSFAAQALRVYELARPHALEIAGSEKPEYLHALRSKLGCHVIKAVEGSTREVERYAGVCDAIAVRLPEPEIELGLELKEITDKPIIFSFSDCTGMEEFLSRVKPFGVSLRFEQLKGQRINSILAKLSP